MNAENNEAATTPTVIVVRRFILHLMSHLDEFLGYYLIKQYGQAYFDTSKAEVKYAQKDFGGSDIQYDKNGDVPIGIGAGRFNEHGHPDRKRDCAATLIAKYIGVRNHAHLEALIYEVFLCDKVAKSTPTQLSSLIKMANRLHPNNSTHVVLNWVTKALHAIVEEEKNKEFAFVAPAEAKSLVSILKSMFDDEENTLGKKDPRVRTEMLRQVNASMRNKDKRITELAHIVECMYRMGYRDDYVFKWLDLAFVAMENEQLEFHQERDRLKSITPIAIVCRHKERERKINLIVCKSDNLLAQKAARSLNNEIVLLQKSTGNYQIFVDVRSTDLNLGNAVRMIRWYEMPEEKRKDISWKELGGRGNKHGVDNWYYAEHGEMLLNGSETHKVEPSKLELPLIIYILKNAFSARNITKWCWALGVKLHEKTETEIEAEVATTETEAPASSETNRESEEQLSRLDRALEAEDASTTQTLSANTLPSESESRPAEETSVPQTQNETQNAA